MIRSADTLVSGPPRTSPMAAPKPVTFVLPGDGRSGGVRVTVKMANLLIGRGHRVRIAMPGGRGSLRSALAQLARICLHGKSAATGFLHEFKGRAVRCRTLGDLRYAPKEHVIAVGTYSVPHLRALHAPVIKLRFNHGFPARPGTGDEQAWRGTIPTITVSHTLVPQLNQLTGGNVRGVVPNGIDPEEYFPQPEILRDGIGAVFNSHPNKASDDLVAVLRCAQARWPAVPQYVFSTERPHPGLRHCRYARFPSVAKAREIYNRSKVWVLTSLTEGLPGVVLEAMACGCVVVSSDNDGSMELIRHMENGVIVKRGDRFGFIQMLGRILDDAPLCSRLAAAATRRAAEFSWDRAVTKMERVLEQLEADPGASIAGEI